MRYEAEPKSSRVARFCVAGGFVLVSAGGVTLFEAIQAAQHDGGAQLTTDHAAKLHYAEEQGNDDWVALGGGIAILAGAVGLGVGLQGAWDRAMLTKNPWIWEAVPATPDAAPSPAAAIPNLAAAATVIHPPVNP